MHLLGHTASKDVHVCFIVIFNCVHKNCTSPFMLCFKYMLSYRLQVVHTNEHLNGWYVREQRTFMNKIYVKGQRFSFKMENELRIK